MLIYSNDSCPPCKKLKEILEKHNIDFKEINASTEVGKILVERDCVTTFPTTIVDGKAFIGFNDEVVTEIINVSKKSLPKMRRKDDKNPRLLLGVQTL